jgi:hypothetical protein
MLGQGMASRARQKLRERESIETLKFYGKELP